MRILFLPKYHNEGPSSRYRTHKYIQYFKESGHEVSVKPLFRDNYVKNLYSGNKNTILSKVIDYVSRARYLFKRGKDFDLLIIEKELFPYIPYIFEKMLLNNKNYTLDYDDAISVRYKNKAFISSIFRNKINSLARESTLVTVGNHWYWSEIQYGKLHYLPTVIDINDYPLSKGFLKNNNKPIIVWIGSPATVKYLNVLTNILLKLSKNYDFKLRIIGAKIHIDELDIECLSWSSEKEFEYIYESDIGIMPLLNSEWEKGKCGFKIIQYMAASLPVVASDSPANNEIIINDETGYIAKNEQDWYDYLEKLIVSSEMREVLGHAGRMRVEGEYTYQAWGNRYIEILENYMS
ncbi:MAG: glycosyltransferase family 4 protein [Eubacteriales bacterium]